MISNISGSKKSDLEITESSITDLFEAWNVKESCRKETGMLRQDFFTFFADFCTSTTLLAKRRGNICGFVICRPSGYISIFGVHPKNFREGIGTSLINKLKDKYTKLWCHVRETNSNAINFYKNMGFKKKKIARNYYTNSDDAFLMVYEDGDS